MEHPKHPNQPLSYAPSDVDLYLNAWARAVAPFFEGQAELPLRAKRCLDLELAHFSLQRPLVLSLSGGRDSALLLFYLLILKSHQPFDLRLFVAEHGWRAASKEETRALLDLAKQFELPIYCRYLDARLASTERKARLQRYAALQEVLEAIDAGKSPAREANFSWTSDASESGHDFLASRLRFRRGLILLGHHQDDQVERFLMNLLRGTGLDGLAAMPEREGCLWRPLLSLTREDIDDEVLTWAIPFFEDESNAKDLTIRNRLRRKLFEAWGEVCDSDPKEIKRQIARAQRHLLGEREALDEQAAQLLKACDLRARKAWPKLYAQGGLVFRGDLPQKQSALFIRALKQIAKAKCAKLPAELRLKEIEGAMKKRVPHACTLLRGLSYFSDGRYFELTYDAPTEFKPLTLDFTEKIHREKNWRALETELRDMNLYWGGSEDQDQAEKRRASWRTLPAARYTLRLIQEKDMLARSDQSWVSAQSFMKKKGIPKPLRKNVLGFFVGEHLLWIPGFYCDWLFWQQLEASL